MKVSIKRGTTHEIIKKGWLSNQTMLMYYVDARVELDTEERQVVLKHLRHHLICTKPESAHWDATGMPQLNDIQYRRITGNQFLSPGLYVQSDDAAAIQNYENSLRNALPKFKKLIDQYRDNPPSDEYEL